MNAQNDRGAAPDARGPTWSRRRLLTAGAAVAVGALAGAGIATSRQVVVERHVVTLPGLTRPLRAVFLVDLHYGPLADAEDVAGWTALARAWNPDLVLWGGDLVDRALAHDPGPLLTEVARLRAPLGAYAVLGNHDHRAFRHDPSGFVARLERSGVRVLGNASARVRADLVVAGVDDLLEGRPDLDAALADRAPGTATVLLSHNPDLLPAVPVGVGLTLAGHTHGGQICLPGGVPIVTSSRYGLRFARGWADAPARGYVSRGLGFGWIPVRAYCPPELTVLDLRPGPLTP